METALSKGHAVREEPASKKRLSTTLVVTSVVIIGSFGSLLVLSQLSSEPNPYVSNFRWLEFDFSPEFNSSYVLAEGIIVNPATTEVNNVTLVLDVYVNYVCHHDGHLTSVKREWVGLGTLQRETNKSFSIEIPYKSDPFYSFRCVGYQLFIDR